MVLTSASSSSSQTKEAQPFRVMVVDDSAIIRTIITRHLESDPRLKVVCTAGNGEMAVSLFKEKKEDIDLIVLDIEMPVMDGLTAIPLLLKEKPGVPIIMASTLTLRNAEISIQALEAGAADYIPKPTSTTDISASDEFRLELIQKARALAAAAVLSRRAQMPAKSAVPLKSPAPEIPKDSVPVGKDTPHAPLRPKDGVLSLRPARVFTPSVLAIGSSTGGPQALLKLMAGLSPDEIKQPVFITQHMPPTFTTILAQHISNQTPWKCREAKDGEVIKPEPGHVYLAPGDYHLLLKRVGTDIRIRLDQGAKENFCRPAVDPMLRSLCEVYNGKVLVIMLTGMGQDGWLGSRHVVEKGGRVIAQDQASSVVWGMPGAVANDGLCTDILPLDKLPSRITSIARGLA